MKRYYRPKVHRAKPVAEEAIFYVVLESGEMELDNMPFMAPKIARGNMTLVVNNR